MILIIFHSTILAIIIRICTDISTTSPAQTPTVATVGGRKGASFGFRDLLKSSELRTPAPITNRAKGTPRRSKP